MSHMVIKHPPLPPSPARGSQEHFNLRVGYVLNPPVTVNLPKEVVAKLLVTIARDAEVHKDWIDGLPEPQRSQLTAILRSGSR